MSLSVCQVQQQETQHDYSLNELQIQGYSTWGRCGGKNIQRYSQARDHFHYPAWLKRLAWALLSQSIIDAKNPGKSNNARRAKEEAVDWICSSDDWLFSYSSVCSILGIDPDQASKVIMNPGFKYTKYKTVK